MQLRTLPEKCFRMWHKQHESFVFLGVLDSLTPGEDHLDATVCINIVDWVYPFMVTVFLLDASCRMMHRVAKYSPFQRLQASTNTAQSDLGGTGGL